MLNGYDATSQFIVQWFISNPFLLAKIATKQPFLAIGLNSEMW